jgi:dTDP-4-dehydrorhamnose 3,5-epimerase
VKLSRTRLAGVLEVDVEPLEDERGFFARTFDAAQFAEAGLEAAVIQCNVSYNRRRDTLRGLHYQADPHGEAKLVRCIAGAIWDVAVDIRPDSPTFRQWHGVELSAANRRALYIGPGLAHGFQTLADDSEVEYQMGTAYVPEAARGVRWDDPAFAIDWPPAAGERIMSDRDRTYPDFAP